jgi:hypothetical protein
VYLPKSKRSTTSISRLPTRVLTRLRLLCRHEVRKVSGPPRQQPRLDATNTAREIERDLVPEWRLKYLDYKVRLTSISVFALAMAMAMAMAMAPADC